MIVERELYTYKNFVLEDDLVYAGAEVSSSEPGTGRKHFVVIPYHHPFKAPRVTSSFEISDEFHFSFNTEKINPPMRLTPRLSREDYISKVNFLKEQIQQGNIYEINFCTEFFSENVVIDPLTVFRRLQQITKAPYSRLVKLGNNYILSASPELFLKKEGNILLTKPIKGTIKRGATEGEDRLLKENLYNNRKERTENVMAVDVARNDLSRIAKRGTVNVNKLYNIESFETVHQMVSTVSCELKDHCNFSEILDAAFPMASMTGAPKISAMNLIGETENFSRNYYSGAMGFIKENGDFELSVVIRSIFYNSETKFLSFAVGSAITHLCEAEKEYDECLLKAKALLEALNAEIRS